MEFFLGVFKLIGIFPIKFTNEYSVSKFLLFYGTFLHTAIIVFGLYCLNNLSDSSEETFRINSVTDSVLIFLDFTTMYCVIISLLTSNFFFIQRICQILNGFIQIDQILKRKFGLKFKKLRTSISFLICLCSICARYLLDSATDGVLISIDIISSIIFTYHLLINLIIFNIEFRLEKLGIILKYRNEQNINFPQINITAKKDVTITEIETAYFRLVKTVKLTNKTFGYQISFLMMYYLVQFILCLYHIYDSISKWPVRYFLTVRQTGYFIAFLTQLFNIVTPCNTTLSNASNIKTIISKKLTSTNSKTNRKELKNLLTKITVSEIKFNILGLFCLENGLLTTVFSTSIMYWTIVTQFQNAY